MTARRMVYLFIGFVIVIIGLWNIILFRITDLVRTDNMAFASVSVSSFSRWFSIW